MTEINHRVSMKSLYFRIAKESAALYEKLDLDYEMYSGLDGDEAASQMLDINLSELFHQRFQAGVTAITFAGMAIENFLYDYAAEKLGDKYVIDYLDKLEIKSKYIIYPQIAYGVSMDKGGRDYQSLSELVKMRNNLVHYKSKPFKHDKMDDMFKHFNDFSVEMKEGVRNAIECVELIIRKFDKLHPALRVKAGMEWD